MKMSAPFRLLALSVMVAVFTGCSKEADRFVGEWQSRNMALSITRAGTTYSIAFKNPSGLLNGTFVGTPTDAGIRVNLGIGGEQLITVSGPETLAFAGETFTRDQGKQAAALRASNDPIWTDPNGITWTRNDNGKGSVTWKEANAYCQALQLGGATDWRLPSIDELQRVYDPSVQPEATNKPRIRAPLTLSNGGQFVWSSTPVSGYLAKWSFNFSQGQKDAISDSAPAYGNARILCVRP
jgi:hypothetical protein